MSTELCNEYKLQAPLSPRLGLVKTYRATPHLLGVKEPGGSVFHPQLSGCALSALTGLRNLRIRPVHHN